MLIKMSIDFVMMILMIVQMAYRFTGNMLHEILGISLFILFIIHNILNRKWYKSMFKVKMNMRRILNIAVNLLFMVMMILLILSAIPISRTVFAFMNIHIEGFNAREIHTLAAYWGLIIMSVHIGMHCEMIIGRVRKMMRKTDKSLIRIIILRILTLLIVIYGVKVSFDRNIGSKLILYYTFDMWNSDESFIKLFLDYLSIVGVYVCGTYYVMKVAFQNKMIIQGGINNVRKF